MNLKSNLILWLARGFGVGQIPFAPGTFGSLVGVAWFLLILLPGSIWFFSAAVVVAAFASVWICGAAEKLLKQKDPVSVVLDEIVALPICFGWWLAAFYSRNQAMPSAEYFLGSATLPMTLGILLAFRLFDIWKPWPIRSSQCLHGGLGVTIDDVLAAAYVNVATWLILSIPAISSRIFSIPAP